MKFTRMQNQLLIEHDDQDSELQSELSIHMNGIVYSEVCNELPFSP